MKKPIPERRSRSGGKSVALPVNDILPDSNVKGKDGKKNNIIKCWKKTNKSGDKGEIRNSK